MPLILPIDTNAPSQLAVELAAVVGQRIAQEVLLLHVSETPPPLDRLAELHGLAAPIREIGVPVRLRTIRGLARERIPEFAEERRASWILMGTSGESFGPGGDSITHAVMRTSAVPVIAVRPGPPAPAPDAPVALVGALPSHRASMVARVIAAAQAVQTHDCGPDLDTAATCAVRARARMTVAPFDPECAAGTWCNQLMQAEPRPVVLVSDGACCCGEHAKN